MPGKGAMCPRCSAWWCKDELTTPQKSPPEEPQNHPKTNSQGNPPNGPAVWVGLSRSTQDC